MPQLKDFKALLFDVDRTLTTIDHRLTKTTIQKLLELSEKGWVVGICTGRAFPTIQNFILPHFPEENLHIVSGGGEISATNGELIHQEPISPEIIDQVINKVAGEKKTLLSTHEKMFVSNQNHVDYSNHPWNIISAPMSLYKKEPVTLFCVVGINQENINEIPCVDQLNVKFLTNNEGKEYVDITAKSVNKATALKIWSQHTGISLEQVVGFGDGDNDLEFLKAVGFGVAMGNADQQLKDIADRVIGHVNFDGLGKYLEAIISGKAM